MRGGEIGTGQYILYISPNAKRGQVRGGKIPQNIKKLQFVE